MCQKRHEMVGRGKGWAGSQRDMAVNGFVSQLVLSLLVNHSDYLGSGLPALGNEEPEDR